MNGEPLTFNDWAPGEPNDLYSDENCTTYIPRQMSLTVSAYVNYNFLWDDVLCDLNSGPQYFDNPFVCERNPISPGLQPENTLWIIIGCSIGGIILLVCCDVVYITIDCDSRTIGS